MALGRRLRGAGSRRRRRHPQARAAAPRCRQRRGTRRPAENLAARNLYLQGRYHLNQRTDEGLQKALDFFEKAIVEDAQFALAHSGLADAHSLLAHYGVRAPSRRGRRRPRARRPRSCSTATAPKARTSLAHVKATQDWDWQGAEREFRMAIGFDPRYATAHHWYATSCLVPLGRLDDALEEMRIAQSLDPVSSIVARDLALIHAYRRDYEAALEQCDHTIELNPHFSPAYWALGVIQEQRRDLDEAIAAFQRAIDLSPHSPRMHAALGRTLALSGRKPLALASLRKVETMAKQRYVSPIEFAAVRFALDQPELGFRWLEQGLRGPRVRRPGAEGRSAVPDAQGRPAHAGDLPARRLVLTCIDIGESSCHSPRIMDRRQFLQGSVGAALIGPLLGDATPRPRVAARSAPHRPPRRSLRPLHPQAGARRPLAIAAVAPIGRRGRRSGDRDGLRRRVPDRAGLPRATSIRRRSRRSCPRS